MKRLLPLIAAAALGCGRGPSPGTPPAPPDEAASLASHPFWKAKVTAADVERIVDVVRAQQGNAIVLIDQQAKAVVHADPYWLAQVRANRDGPAGHSTLPEGLGPKVATIDMDRWRSRPSRAEVLKVLREELDWQDFHGQ